jgi:phosphoribosylglycinamide formyltransferase 2
MNETAIAFADIDRALAVSQSDLRLFGKPEAFERRRMGVALAYGNDVEDCRRRAGQTASCVKPERVAG